MSAGQPGSDPEVQSGWTRPKPPLVDRFLQRALPRGMAYPRRVRIHQQGEMCLRPGGAWQPFTAIQDFEADRSYFEWRARVGLAGPLAMYAVDRFENGRGSLTVKLLGIPFVSVRGPETDVGELMRYLAELPWNPGALALHDGLTWNVLDERRVEVRCVEGEAVARVTMLFSEVGDVVGIRALRPKERGAPPMAWGGDFGEYGELSGVRVPQRAEVWWDRPEGRHQYFRGRLVSLAVGDG